MAVTVETSPVFIQANNYSAELTRRGTFGFELQRGSTVGSVLGGLVGSLSGVPDLQVTYSGGGLTVNIAAGEVIVPGSSSNTQGGYYLRVTTAGTLTPAAANGSNPRIDLLYAQVQDQAYTGSSNLGTVAIATGTPTSGATLTNLSGAPIVPTSAIAIAYILIPQSASTISNADILNEYPMVYFGPNIFNKRPSTGSLSANSGDHIIVSSGSGMYTLPVPFVNARVRVTNYGSGTVVVAHNASEVIYGLGCTSAGVLTFSLGAYGATATVESDGTNWFIIAGQQDSGWIAVSFTNSWVNESTFTAAGYRLQGDRVSLRGGIGGGANGTSPFTLPAGYRPTARVGFAIENPGSVSPGVSVVDISSGGVVTVTTVTAASSGLGYVLDSISFTVD